MEDYLNLSGLTGMIMGSVAGATTGYALTQNFTDSNVINSLGILIGAVSGAISGAEIGLRLSGREGILSKINKSLRTSIDNKIEQNIVTQEQQEEHELFYKEKPIFPGLEETLGTPNYTELISKGEYTLPTKYGDFTLKVKGDKLVMESSEDFKDGYEGNPLISIRHTQAKLVAFKVGIEFSGKAYNPQLSRSWYQNAEKVKLLERTRRDSRNSLRKSFDLTDILDPNEERPPAKFQVELRSFNENSIAKAAYKMRLAGDKLKEILKGNCEDDIPSDEEIAEVSSGTYSLN